MKGTVVAVCTSMTGGIPKKPQPHVTVGQWGFVGDYHNREMRPSFSEKGVYKPNTDRQISLVALEVLRVLGEDCWERALRPGELAENITTRGLGDLSQIVSGTKIYVGMRVVLRVEEQNEPCKNVRAAYGLKFYERVKGRRGLLCSIERGVGEVIHPGDPIEIP